MKILQYLAMIAAAVIAIATGSAWNIPKADITEELKAPGYTVEELEARAAARETTQAATEPQTEPQTPAEPSPEFVYYFSEDDGYLLTRVAYLEAGNQGWEGMAAVMNVIINRANKCNASIRAIVYSPGQFDGVTPLIESCTPSPEASTALWAVMQGWDASAGALYFCSPAHNSWHSSHLTYLFSAWGHEFYK